MDQKTRRKNVKTFKLKNILMQTKKELLSQKKLNLILGHLKQKQNGKDESDKHKKAKLLIGLEVYDYRYLSDGNQTTQIRNL